MRKYLENAMLALTDAETLSEWHEGAYGKPLSEYEVGTWGRSFFIDLQRGGVQKHVPHKTTPQKGPYKPETAPTRTAVPNCPKCDGPMWDNRPKKASQALWNADAQACRDQGLWNPAGPDFKCKDRENCEGVVWPPKDEPAPVERSVEEFTTERLVPKDDLPFD